MDSNKHWRALPSLTSIFSWTKLGLNSALSDLTAVSGLYTVDIYQLLPRIIEYSVLFYALLQDVIFVGQHNLLDLS
jgi:hypothetical protein